MKLLVFIQFDQDKINPVSLESLQAAQEISSQSGGEVSAIIFNQTGAETLTKYDLSEILLIENPQLDTYNPLFYIKTVEEIIKSESPDVIVIGHTYEARDWVPRLSARLNIPFISDCIGINTDNGLTLTRSIYQGNFNADMKTNENQFIVSFQSGAFKMDSLISGSASIKNISVDLSSVENTIRPGERFQESETSVDLSQADVIVAVGRGIGKEENLDLAKDLAKSLGGELASSRPVVDSGWLEPYHQVGSSGQTVSPTLYFAIGISGAIQHVVGMKSAKNIVVINKDPNAPLFEIADYGVVGDLFEIVPKLITAIQDS